MVEASLSKGIKEELMADRTGRVVHNDTDRYHFFMDGKTCDDRCVLVTDDEAVQWIWGRTDD